MKWSMMLNGDTAQFNLDAENEYEKELCKILSKFQGAEVTVTQGANIGLNAGGYMREWDPKETTCAITIRKPDTLPVGP